MPMRRSGAPSRYAASRPVRAAQRRPTQRSRTRAHCGPVAAQRHAGCQPDANAVALFPPAAELVPLYSLSMLKHAILRPGAHRTVCVCVCVRACGRASGRVACVYVLCRCACVRVCVCV